MPDLLDASELLRLLRGVFAPKPEEGSVAFLVDLPPEPGRDREAWRVRRALAHEWVRQLSEDRSPGRLDAFLYLYPAVGQNNADLPERLFPWSGDHLPASGRELAGQPAQALEEILARHRLVVAPTEYSATAPLKNLARRLGFRAATMPGFSPAMIPALRLDIPTIHRRVSRLAELLTAAERAEFVFAVDGAREERLVLDLRYRAAHLSSGRLVEPGSAGNLPSGEAYIVPYEGERPGDPSRSRGRLPVQLGDEIATYLIEENRARSVEGDGPAARQEAERLARDPAYGNLAELGLGVLGPLGVKPVGEVLLDEKLAPHLAFGRSDHFGGQVGPADFSAPERAVHIDRVYNRTLQPRVHLRALDLVLPDRRVELVRDGEYVIDFGEATNRDATDNS
ncbi:MAG: hypothetical protein GYA21_16510 [Myxococcales bacterium]|nr:hypothetical protein [Myxococcales bacterium]